MKTLGRGLVIGGFATLALLCLAFLAGPLAVVLWGGVAALMFGGHGK